MGLLDYIKGNRRGKEANRIERDAMTDAFLQEALDGYDAVLSNHIHSIERLEQRVMQHAQRKKQNRFVLYLSAAATVLILITVGSLFLIDTDKNKELIGKVEKSEKEIPVSKQNPAAPVKEETSPVDNKNGQVPPPSPMQEVSVEADNAMSTIEYSSVANESPAEDVVTTGYAAKKAKSPDKPMVMKSEELKDYKMSGAMDAMQGKIAGAAVSESEGSPDADVKVRVRGGSSLTQANEPLYIVDGKPRKDISDIPTKDIQSIEVLKDANSTSIYGARGANGVIVVTTKAAESKKKKTSFAQKEFKAFFMSKVKKKACGDAKNYVEVEFTLNADQYPSSFRIPKSSCEEAKSEVIRILSYSPRWTEKAGEVVRMKLSW